MTKKFYINRTADFGNTYELFWADSPEMVSRLPEGAERITRQEALKLARQEAYRRKHDSAFSGYADNAVYPAGYNGDIANDPRYQLIGRIWERV